MNENWKNSGLRGSRALGIVAIITLTLKHAFSKGGEVREASGPSPAPAYPVGLWENADMWQRRSLR